MDFGYSAFEASEAYAAADFELLGDPYREEPVCRGVSMAADAVPPPPLGSFGWEPFAFQPDEIYGADIGLPMPAKLGDPVFELGSSWDQFTPASGSKSSGSRAPLAERFTQKNQPPRLPTDNFFQLESTTFRVCAEPSRLGNALLDFWHARVVCTELKVNHSKFSIKAAVFHGSSTCSLKLRVYEVAQGVYAVEFQRRRGDCVLCLKLFDKLAKHLRSDPHCRVVEGSVPTDPTGDLRVEGRLRSRDVSSLINMAAYSETLPTDVLEDVAKAFARIAQDGRTSALLCTASAARALASLLQDSTESVALPAARALRSLAQHQDTEHFFAHSGLIDVVRDQLRAAPASSIALRHELATLLRAVAAAEHPPQNR